MLIWYTHSDVAKSFVLRVYTYAFIICWRTSTVVHVYFSKFVRAKLKLSDPNDIAQAFVQSPFVPYF